MATSPPHRAHEFLSSRGEDSQQFLKKCAEPDLFKQAIETTSVFEKVPDWRLLVKGLGTFKKNVYDKELHGESLENVIETRFEIASNCFPEQFADKSKQMQFVAWVFFESRKGYVYAPQYIIKSFCTKNSIDMEDFMDVLVRHPDYKNLYTSKDIRMCEVAIERWLSQATPSNTIKPKDSPLLDASQNKSLKQLMTSGYTVLQGNAGCGKTTTVCEMIKQLIAHDDVMVVAAAFTHKAKKCIEVRMKKAGLENQVLIGTLHSVIGIIRAIEQHKHIFLILDEASMLDIELLGELAFTMTNKTIKYQVCFVGDYFQIQPVGRGEFFRQMVEDDQVVHTLHKCYRTDHQDLFKAYENVRNGKLPESSENFKVDLVSTDKEISSLVGKHIKKHLDKYQIICWQNKHIWMINQWVQKALFAANRIGPGCYRSFYTNDKVVYCGVNDDTVTNAMTGTVINASPAGMMIKWENKEKASLYKDTTGINLSYAISAHKSQGSEYSHVIVVCYEVEKMNKCLDKRWLYTSITRGQEQVILVATQDIRSFVEKKLSNIPIHNIKIKYEYPLSLCHM